MAMRSILVPATSAADCGDRVRVAIDLGRRLEAHIRCLFVRDDPHRTYRNSPDVIRAAGVTEEQIEREGVEEAGRCRLAFQSACTDAGLSSDGRYHTLHATFGTWIERIGSLEPIVAGMARTSDLVVVGHPNAHDIQAERLFDAAVFSSGRPTLVLRDAPSDDLLRHVVIAWNHSLEGARLIGHALDILHAADRVSVIASGTDYDGERSPSDLIEYLTFHGIRANRIVPGPNPKAPFEEIVSTAKRSGATLLAMGAFTHGRIRQFFLGGLTQAALAHAPMALLMEH